MLEAISRVLDRVNQESGIDFALMPPAYQSRPLGRSAEVRAYYRGPRNTPGPARIKFDLTMDEKVVCPPVLRSVSHDYTDALPRQGRSAATALRKSSQRSCGPWGNVPPAGPI